MISVIVPVLNEEPVLAGTLESLPCGSPDGELEVLVVDGGSHDASVAIARERGARVVVSPPGRAVQMNRGAGAARGSLLVFLHADTRLDGTHLGEIRRLLAHGSLASHGSFAIRFAESGRGLRAIARLANLRTRLDRTPYGDQALFCRRSAFEAVGGYDPVPICEDVSLARRLRTTGRYVFVRHLPVTTSARRWLRDGLVTRTLRNVRTRLLWELGVAPERLVASYHGRPATSPAAGGTRG